MLFFLFAKTNEVISPSKYSGCDPEKLIHKILLQHLKPKAKKFHKFAIQKFNDHLKQQIHTSNSKSTLFAHTQILQTFSLSHSNPIQVLFLQNYVLVFPKGAKVLLAQIDNYNVMHIINIEHLTPSMNVSRPTLTPNRFANFPFPINSLKRSHCYFPSTDSSFTSDRKNDYCGKRNGETSTECNTRDSVITVDQTSRQISSHFQQIKDYVLQNLESLPLMSFPKKTIDLQSHQTKFCSSLKAIRKPKVHHQLFFGPDCGKNLSQKDSYYEMKTATNQEEFIKTTKSIQAYPLFPGDTFSYRSFFPQKVVDAYQRMEKKNLVHFVHGYISSIDCLYFVVEKLLFLHFPIGSRLSQRQSENTIEMQFSSIVYSIKDTMMCLNGKQQTNVIVIGHQFHFELYKVNETQKNPLVKLDLKYSTPNLYLPITFTQKNGVVYYLPDNETTNIASLDLRTGEVLNLQCIQVEKQQNQKQHSIQSTIRQAWQAKNEFTWQNIREKLNQKLAKSLLYDPNNWVLKIGTRHCLEAKNLKMVSCASSNTTFIICLLQIKYVGVLGKYLKAQDESLDRNAKMRKLIRVYWREKGEATMNFDHIEFDETKLEILDIRASKAKTKENEEFFQITLLNKQTRTIVQKQYCINPQSLDSSICQPKFNCVKSTNFMKNVHLDFKMIGYENEKSLFSDGIAVFANEKDRTLLIKDKKLELSQTFNKVEGEYIGITTNANLDSSLIVTLGSDEGYVRVIQLTFLQWVFSAIQLELFTTPQRFSIESFAQKLLINFIYACHKKSQSPSQSLVDLTASQIMKYFTELMTNLIILSNFRQDSQKNEILKFAALVKNVVTIKYLPISHHVNDLSISLISHYSLHFKSILDKNGMQSNFKLSNQNKDGHVKCSLNQIRDFIQQKTDKRSKSKSFSPIHKLTHSHQQIEQEVYQQNQKNKDSNIPVQPFLLSVQISDPNLPFQQTQDQDRQVILEPKGSYSSPHRQKQKHDDYNKTIKSTNKANRESQSQQIKDKVDKIQQKLFPQQNKGLYKSEKDRNNVEISSAINKFCIANALVKIMNSVWRQPIGQISINKVEMIIDQINSIKNLGQEIGEYSIPKQNQQSYSNSPMISAFEDQDLSKIRYQSRQFFENKLIYYSLCETLELTKMIGYLCPNITFREAYTQHSWKFAQPLFIEFMKDYDSMLLDAWDAQMQRYINCKIEIDPNPHLKSMTLKFWLQLYVQISPVHNKTKITKMIQNSIPNNWKFISQQKTCSLIEQLKQNDKKTKEVYVILPQFFLNFVQTDKGLTQTDIHYCFID